MGECSRGPSAHPTCTVLGAKSPLPPLCPCLTPPCSGCGAHGSEQSAFSPQRHGAGVGWAGHGGSWFPVPSPHALHVGAQPDARTAPAPSCWETLCSHPTGRPLPPSRGERSLLLRELMSCARQRWERAAVGLLTVLGGAGCGGRGKSNRVREMDQKTISTSLARWLRMCGNRTKSRSPTVTEHYYHAMP